jgi:hypothetical protein
MGLDRRHRCGYGKNRTEKIAGAWGLLVERSPRSTKVVAQTLKGLMHQLFSHGKAGTSAIP